ncbi:MAG: DegT/DnrJ/EryC1/StrS family aminotransferase [Bacteroidota bacterium]
MKVPFVDLHAQYKRMQAEIDAAIADVLQRTAFIGGGTVKAWEAAFGEWLGRDHVIACGNGTDSLEILLAAFGIGPGDEVIVPAHSWISTAECVNMVGATPIFVDTIDGLYTIDPALIEAKITPATKAIIPVHLCGLPAEMDPIMALAEQHKLVVIEDCAQAHGARYKGKKVGTIGHAASFSFYPGKNLGAYGDAGSMATNDKAIALRARKIANHGQLTKHAHEFPGRNSRLDGLQAAILLAKLPHLDQWTAERQAHGALYRELLEPLGVHPTQVPDHMSHVYHLFMIQVANRDEVQTNLKAAGISTGVHYPTPLPLLQAYSSGGHHASDFPSVSAYTPKILSLPIYPEMSRDMIEYVVEQLKIALHVPV